MVDQAEFVTKRTTGYRWKISTFGNETPYLCRGTMTDWETLYTFSSTHCINIAVRSVRAVRYWKMVYCGESSRDYHNSLLLVQSLTNIGLWKVSLDQIIPIWYQS